MVTFPLISLLAFTAIIIGFTYFIGIYRNNWVYKQMILFNNKCYEYRFWVFWHTGNSPEWPYELDIILGKYDNWLWRFWCWDPRKLAIRKDIYDLVMNFEEEDVPPESNKLIIKKNDNLNKFIKKMLPEEQMVCSNIKKPLKPL